MQAPPKKPAQTPLLSIPWTHEIAAADLTEKMPPNLVHVRDRRIPGTPLIYSLRRRKPSATLETRPIPEPEEEGEEGVHGSSGVGGQ